MVYQGANRLLSVEQINRCRYLFQNARYCLLSLEIPEAIAEYTIKFCRRNDTQVILKPSAVEKIKEELLKDIAYLCPMKMNCTLSCRDGCPWKRRHRSFWTKGWRM